MSNGWGCTDFTMNAWDSVKVKYKKKKKREKRRKRRERAFRKHPVLAGRVAKHKVKQST